MVNPKPPVFRPVGPLPVFPKAPIYSAPDSLFGVPVPVYTPQPSDVFPYDPDVAYKRVRRWETTVHQINPLCEWRVIRNPLPQISWNVGFAAMKGNTIGTNLSTGAALPATLYWQKMQNIYGFFQNHQGKRYPFYFYDPVLWAGGPSGFTDLGPGQNYVSNPPDRANSSDPTLGRYVLHFNVDEMSFEMFAYLLSKTSVEMVGLAG
jgi:hypothetical protein